jgi:dihydropteroate synthase
VQRIVRDIGIPVSVDTSKPEVMEEALRAGAAMINDVRALRAPGALEVVAASQAPVCLMHMQGTPTTMQREPRYRDVVAEVKDFLEDRLQACERAGIGRDRTIVDPGFGFGKTLAHNLSLLNNIGRLRELGVALLVGLSRKSMLGAILDAPVEERLYGGLAAAVLAVWQGAHIVRTHDVGPTVEALRVCGAVRSAE